VDYAFVPGFGDTALQVLAKAYERRPQATLVVLQNPPDTLSSFLAALEFGIETMGFDQAGDLLVGAHGTQSGYLLLAMDPSHPSPANYETVKSLATIKIPAGVGTASTSVRLGSCNLGSARPFLEALKTALGNPKSLSAPRYVHAFHYPSGTDYWEYMQYDFSVLGDYYGAPLASRDDVVQKFIQADFKLLDDTVVPSANWETWVPTKAKLNLDPWFLQEFDFPFLVKNVDTFMAGFAYAHWGTYHEHTTVTLPINDVILDVNTARNTLVEQLSQDGRFKPNHPFPIYVRFGYDSTQSFVDGWDWSWYPEGTNALKFFGWRYRYQLNIPVSEPVTNQWIFNYYPETGTPTFNFSESTRPELFGIV
jgi:hypothetical protein